MLSPVKIWRRQKEIRNIIGKQGRILSWTKIYVSTCDFKKYAPYFVIIVEFNKGDRAVGQLVDFQEPKINDKVEAIVRKVREASMDGVIAYGIKFKPIKKNDNL